MTSLADLDHLSPEQLRTLAAELMVKVDQRDQALHKKDQELLYRQTRIDQFTHEISVLKHLKFGQRSKQLNAEQASLLEETIDADVAAIEAELEQFQSHTPAHWPRQ